MACPLSALLELREKRGEPFTEGDLLQVILPLLSGLKRAHESGLYHRDIKPSNILIRRKDNQPVLIDFGAAKQETSGVTKSMAPYTDGYAAMEQVGEGAIGPWTDIYGVGAVMWRMVAGGNPPWEPPSLAKVQQRAYAVMQGGADPLPSASVVGQGRFLPRLLESIDQCLEIPDASRIRSCDELLAKVRERDLAAVSPSDATEGRNRVIASQPRLKKRARRDRPAASRYRALVVTLTLLLVTIAAVITLREFAVFNWYRLGAEQGHAGAQNKLGIAYAKGEGADQDYAESVRWFRLAAEQGNANGQNSLGFAFWNGIGVDQDYAEALRWYRLSAEQGNADGQKSLGVAYWNGSGVDQDYAESVRWFRLAAEQGNADGQTNLGHAYANGFGVNQNDAEAVRWYRLAPRSKAMPTLSFAWELRTPPVTV